MALHKDWMKEDNSANFTKSKNKRNTERVMETIIMRGLLHCNPPKEVGAVVKKFKRIASPEELEALKDIKGNNHTKFSHHA